MLSRENSRLQAESFERVGTGSLTRFKTSSGVWGCRFGGGSRNFSMRSQCSFLCCALSRYSEEKCFSNKDRAIATSPWNQVARVQKQRGAVVATCGPKCLVHRLCVAGPRIGSRPSRKYSNRSTVSFSSTFIRPKPPLYRLQKTFERSVGPYVELRRNMFPEECRYTLGGCVNNSIAGLHSTARYTVSQFIHGTSCLFPLLQLSFRSCQRGFPSICNFGALVEVDTQVLRLFLLRHSE